MLGERPVRGATYSEYGFHTDEPSHMHQHFLPVVLRAVEEVGQELRVLDVGCGNGATCGALLRMGCEVVGIDPSHEGIAIAREAHPEARFEQLTADGELLVTLEETPFDVVVSTEVIEHLYAPRKWARSCFGALRPGGRLICSTPYHGYLKNLVISALGRWDRHVDPLWDGGHIKMWSRRTLTRLLEEAGFVDLSFQGCGRIPFLWMTMVISADKPR